MELVISRAANIHHTPFHPGACTGCSRSCCWLCKQRVVRGPQLRHLSPTCMHLDMWPYMCATQARRWTPLLGLIVANHFSGRRENLSLGEWCELGGSAAQAPSRIPPPHQPAYWGVWHAPHTPHDYHAIAGAASCMCVALDFTCSGSAVDEREAGGVEGINPAHVQQLAWLQGCAAMVQCLSTTAPPLSGIKRGVWPRPLVGRVRV